MTRSARSYDADAWALLAIRASEYAASPALEDGDESTPAEVEERRQALLRIARTCDNNAAVARADAALLRRRA